MKRTLRNVLPVIFVLTIILCGCSEKITKGEVVNKKYSPAYTQTQMIPVIYSDGKTSHTILTPYTYYYSEKWEVTIQQWNPDDHKIQKATYRITEEVYNNIEIGAEFVYSKEMEPNYPEYTREKNDTSREKN